MKYLFFASGVTPDGTSTTEEVAMLKLSDLSCIVNGGADEIHMIFKDTGPTAGASGAAQMDDVYCTVACANASIREAILELGEVLSRFEKDPAANVLRVYDGTATQVTKCVSSFSGCAINAEEPA